MKNKDRKIIWALAFILAFSLGLPAQAADDHSHFEAEKVKAGVIQYRSWTAKTDYVGGPQAEINCDWFVDSWVYPAGSEHAAYYDSSLDGAVLPVAGSPTQEYTVGRLHPKYCNGSPDRYYNLTLYKDPNLGPTQIWFQVEMYISDDSQLPYMANLIDNMKIFRTFHAKGDCTGDPSKEVENRWLTMHWFSSGRIQYPYSSNCFGMSDISLPDYWPVGKWFRFTYMADIQNNLYKSWVTDIANGTSSLMLNVNPVFPATLHPTTGGPLLHHSLRGKVGHRCQDFPECVSSGGYEIQMGYRNWITSTQPIALVSGTSGSISCGDGSCNGTETCSTCPGDCGACKGDLNSDGKVDIFDYSLFISDFGKTGTGLSADLNSDGKVDIFDYSMFISNFGK